MAWTDLLGSLLKPTAPSGIMEGEWEMAGKSPSTPNVWNEPANTTTVGGFPLWPILGAVATGLAGAGLGFGFSDKHNRNRDMVRGLLGGMRAGFNFLNEPNERARREEERRNELLIRQGWSPLHGPGATPQVGTTLPPDLNAPMLPAPASEKADNLTLSSPAPSVPKAPMGIRMGGMTFYAPPAPVRIKAGDVYSDLPPALANQEVTFNPDLIPEVIRGAREKKTEGFYRSQVPGFESAPLPVLSKEYDRMRAQQAAEKAIGMMPQGSNVTVKMRYDPASQTVVPEFTTESESSAKLRQGELDYQNAQLKGAQERSSNEALITGARVESEKAQRAAAEARRKEIEERRETADLGRTIGGLETANTNLRTSIGNINEEIGKLSLDPTRAKEIKEQEKLRDSLQKQYDRNLSRIEPLRNKLSEQQGLPILESEKPLDPIDEQVDAAMVKYSGIIKNLPSFDSLEKLPKPKGGAEIRGYNNAAAEMRSLLDNYIPMIEQTLSKQWTSRVPPELELWIKGEIGNEGYDFVMRNYKKGYRPASLVPPLPTGVVPPVPVSSPLSQPMP